MKEILRTLGFPMTLVWKNTGNSSKIKNPSALKKK